MNNEKYGSDKLTFIQGDIIKDELPVGELCLVRQVLQHLSNDCVASILKRLHKFSYVLITDGQTPIPASQRRNFDMPTSPATRGELYNNGLWLELPPFNVEASEVLSYPIKSDIPYSRVLRTLLIENND